MIISSAGMPFTYIYRYKEKTVVDIPLKGMPLGSFPGFDYQSQKIDLNKGDTLLFHSDGLSESFNQEGEVFGESRIKSLFNKTARQEPEQIIKQLTEASTEWLGNSQPSDDMTLVVIKIK
jgi:sigma-B regulation protein RsbU (phosphoserine phosphatase)